MKKIMETKNVFRFISGKLKCLSLAAGTIVAFCGAANADDFLLTINDSNPSAVTFTTTGSNPFANSTDTTTQDGVDLLRFFLTSISSTSPVSIVGNLTPSGTDGSYGDPYTSWLSDNESGSYIDLALFNPSSVDSQIFSTLIPAFTGSATVNLATYSSLLPTVGTSGTLISGFAGSEGGKTPIGSWVVVSAVPEPGTWVLAALGMGGLLCLHRRKRRIRGI